MGGPVNVPEVVPAAEPVSGEVPAAVPWMTPDEVQAVLRHGDGAL